MLFGLRAKPQFVNVFDDVSKVIPAEDFVLISAKICPILYSIVFGPLARCVNPCRYGNSLPLTKSRRSSPVNAVL
jgi:hypothetical protein